MRYVMRPGGEHVNATLIREGYATAIRTFPTPGGASVYSSKPRRDGRGAADGPTEAGGGPEHQLKPAYAPRPSQTQETPPHAREHPQDGRNPQRAGEQEP